ncbi:MAG TPA: hypothetical protein VLD85_14585, partial [Anaeromyxobacteraceae bacterium]|nr:hypothetical protein [Anaeromyxobacteraceae bacterium]
TDRFELGVEPPARAPSAPPEEWLKLDLAAEARAAAEEAPLAAAPPVTNLEDLDFGETVEAGPPLAPEPLELPEVELEEQALELAPMHAFVPPPETVGHRPEPAAAARPAAVPQGGTGFTPGGAEGAGDGGEAQLREALSRASREVIEKIAWEVVPALAETIIREHVDRLVREKERS